MTQTLPRIISELQSEDWLSHLFNEFDLDHKNTPKYNFEQGLYTHTFKFKPYEFKSYKAKGFNINLSKYFQSFEMTIETNSNIFDNIEEFCTSCIFLPS